jgi:hypothetical protein
MAGKPFITNEDVETAVGAIGRGIVAVPRLLLWAAFVVALGVGVGELVGGAILTGTAVLWALLYALPATRGAACRTWRHAGPFADDLRLWVGWEPGSRPDWRARRKGSAMVRNVRASARDDGQSIKHTNPNGSVRYTDPRGVSLEVTPLGVRLVVRPTKRHTAEGLAKMQDAYASRLGVQAPERLAATVLDQKHVAFEWEYLDPYEGTRMGGGVEPDSKSRRAA